MKITIGYIYPKLLNMFGDIGNITALKKRCEWRNIEVCVKEFHTGDEIDLTDIDILYLGGGGERETLISLENLMNCKETLKDFVEDNGVSYDQYRTFQYNSDNEEFLDIDEMLEMFDYDNSKVVKRKR